jgi:hypothetical protein
VSDADLVQLVVILSTLRRLMNVVQAVERNQRGEPRYCDVFGRMPSLLGNLKLDTPVVARQPKVKHRLSANLATANQM